MKGEAFGQFLPDTVAALLVMPISNDRLAATSCEPNTEKQMFQQRYILYLEIFGDQSGILASRPLPNTRLARCWACCCIFRWQRKRVLGSVDQSWSVERIRFLLWIGVNRYSYLIGLKQLAPHLSSA